jgi:hypothetical protein
MDPATIGLLISIAPTILDLLFGRGVTFGHVRRTSVIKHETMPKKMYGYGLEGYGYRYPPIEGYYEEPIQLGTITRGRLAGKPLKRYPPKVDKRWVAAYLLNKQYAANKWREIASKYLQAASQEYLNELKKTDREAYARALLNKKRREARKDQLPLALRTPQGQKLYEELLQIKDDKQKLREAYYGKPRKERKLKALKPEEIERIIQEEEGLLMAKK